jgi:hypothetical protein
MHQYILAQSNNDQRVCGIRLYVARDNRRAHTAYQRVGLLPNSGAVRLKLCASCWRLCAYDERRN